MDEEEFSRQPVPPRGQILLGTCLSFGITAFLIVLLRVVFRFSRQKFTISDVCISLAVVRRRLSALSRSRSLSAQRRKQQQLTRPTIAGSVYDTLHI